MKVVVYSTKKYDKNYFELVNVKYGFELEFYDFLLNDRTAKMAEGADAVCIFVNDIADRHVLQKLAQIGVKFVALRCAGFNNVDLQAAKEFGLKVVRVPAYSPEAVAEHTVGLMLALNRRINKAYNRTRDANFSLEGLIGFNMHGRTAGVIGSGKIGVAVMRILKGFGMNILTYDPFLNPAAVELGAEYVDLDTLYAQSQVITLHCPATAENHHLLDKEAFAKMRDGVLIVNTSRGSLINTTDALQALKSRKIRGLGIDVYENERDLFFEDKSNEVILDDTFSLLAASHNVLMTGHQAFLTEEALTSIAEVTLHNIADLVRNIESPNEVKS
ncbi:2-hydroxyacid dehydrogenase [Testudinibacter sp. TR-2022]|uniref:2-hydroxyacid dehydrogenase n=1 Tax=Testudinibacter sp. TR-2022 TaxID=2585029 RepID=UPI001119FD6F|nr:2-hydroxyacid dehydrogenase [Testudinibacter sp. TR-2022]TNH04303.1 2-hydroxyacid dehydrogenase [Pasteurellaceae bacterium Phil31]TNH10116.1 2-hydroxyacid dehydrogenase [Testudinibacter sp. TR-2022]TNH12496.1 2-hydroxyacid dehydrogenase [Testudinibacter sp. TR-2022]TNH14805.1 2-hydroxyacid dehydrogenase [Testudinibacter sp. TR-2022]TNH16309.1 2-hydroxyacid dehydrogenase [Testudinibacter sp. TR-2022]